MLSSSEEEYEDPLSESSSDESGTVEGKVVKETDSKRRKVVWSDEELWSSKKSQSKKTPIIEMLFIAEGKNNRSFMSKTK